MQQITLKYTRPNGDAATTSLVVLSVKGTDPCDEIELFPGVQHELPDGVLIDERNSLRRVVTIDFGVQSDSSKRLAIIEFVLDPFRVLNTSDWGDITLALEDTKRVVAEHRNGFSKTKAYKIRFRETTVNDSVPTQPE